MSHRVVPYRGDQAVVSLTYTLAQIGEDVGLHHASVRRTAKYNAKWRDPSLRRQNAQAAKQLAALNRRGVDWRQSGQSVRSSHPILCWRPLMAR